MTEPPFDPYYIWLGIPPKDQPPNLYRLLGIDTYEQNIDVIESAAQRQITHLRTFANGLESGLSQELLNEVASARVILLNPARKTEYDKALMQSHAADKLDQERAQQPIASHFQVPSPSFSAPATSAQRPSRRKENKRSSWNKPLLVSGLIIISVAICILLVNAFQQDTELAQAALRPAIQSMELSSSQGPTMNHPSVTEEPATPSVDPQDDTISQAAQSSRAHDTSPAAKRPAVASAQDQTVTDLLSLVRLDVHSLAGNWERLSDGVIGTGTTIPMQLAILEVPFAARRAFAIEFEVKRLSSVRNGFVVRIPVWEGSFLLYIDQRFNRVPFSAIGDNSRVLDRVKGAVLNEAKLATIRCEIRENGISVLVDGKPCVSWKGDLTLLDTRKFQGWFADDKRVHKESPYELPNRDSIYICASHGASYLISRIEVFPANAESNQPNELLSQNQLSELLINKERQLDYFSPLLNCRMHNKWSFLELGQLIAIPPHRH